MLSAVLKSLNTFEMRETEIPAFGPDEVLLRIRQAGICGSDMQMYHGKHQHLKMPQVIGHECVATVEAIGSRASIKAFHPFTEGQRVTVYPQIGCASCPSCRAGKPNLCNNQKFAGLHRPGFFQEFAVMPAWNIHPLPSTLSDDLAMLVEPTAVAAHVLRIGEITESSRVVVIGAGAIGHLVAELSHGIGAKVMSVESLPNRAAAVKTVGADAVYTGPLDGLSAAVTETFGEDGANVFVISRAVASDLNTILHAVTNAATVVVVGNYKEPVTVDWTLIERRELVVKGSLQYIREDFVKAIDYLEKGLVDPDAVITHRYPFALLPEAFRFIDANYKDVLKIAVTF